MTALNKLIDLASAIDNQLLYFEESTSDGGNGLRNGMTVSFSISESDLFELDKELYKLKHNDFVGFEHKDRIEVNILGIKFEITSKNEQ